VAYRANLLSALCAALAVALVCRLAQRLSGSAAAGVAAAGALAVSPVFWSQAVVAEVYALNAVCAKVGGCGTGSPQETWLRADLAAHPAACTLAYWHDPRFSSGSLHGSSSSYQPFWQALYAAGADVVLNGHDHTYERFAPQTPTGSADAARGIREFVVGTGGRSHYAFGTPIANSEVRNSDTFGVLNEQHAEGPRALRQAIPGLLELARDEGVTQVGRMDVEAERPKPKPPLDRHESLPPQGWVV